MITVNVLLWRIGLLSILAVMMSVGCVHQLAADPAQEELREPIVYGQIDLWQEEPSGRIFLPELAAFEFINNDGGRRYRVVIGAATSFFFLTLDPGHYQVTRVFIQEGGFRASAEVPLGFEVPEQGIAYLGKWRFRIGSPNFMRKLEVKVFSQPIEALVELRVQYPSASLNAVKTRLAEPVELRSRLYEMTPYPRFRWFNRQTPT
jgi:hypothetical protein